MNLHRSTHSILAFTGHSIRAAAGTITLATALSGITSLVQAQGLAAVEAVFAVEINGQLTEGKNRLDVTRDDERYHVDFVLDHWMVSVRQHADFDMKACTVRPQTYEDVSKRPFAEKSTQTLEFDWAAGVAHYRNADGAKDFPLDDRVYDPISLFFEARCGLMAGEEDFIYPVIRKGSLRTQHYQVVDRQPVETGMGTFEALVVERVRKSRKRRTRLYVAPELDYLLVRIEHQESSLLKVAVTLEHMDYRLLP